MRITLSLEDDAIEAIQAYARNRRLSLSKAASELVRRCACSELGIRNLNGLPVFDAPDNFPLVTTSQVRGMLEGKSTVSGRAPGR